MKRKKIYICIAVIICCVLMALVDGFLRPPYFVKSGVKIFLFTAVPLFFAHKTKLRIFSVLKPEKRGVIIGLILGAATFGVVMGAYLVLSPYVDLSAIPEALSDNAGITKENFPLVATYIALCNSLLEEFFFRGFAFIQLKKESSATFAMIFSSAAFALYHGAIMDGWMNPLLTALLLLALFGCGIFFNYLNVKRESVWASWLMHFFANLAINTIGMILLGCFR